MIGLNRIPLDMNEREIRQWLKEQSHPAVESSRQYYVSEWIKRTLSAVFVGAPAIAFLLLAVIMPIETSPGDAINHLMILLYVVGLINSTAYNFLIKSWRSPLDEAVDDCLAHQAVTNALNSLDMNHDDTSRVS